MRLVCFGCSHSFETTLDVPPGDVLICTGDFTGNDSLFELPKFNAWLGTLPHPVKLFVPGNHDHVFEDSLNIAKVMLSNAHVLVDEEIIIQGFKIYGTPWQPYFNNWAFNVASVEERTKKFNKIPEDTNVLITHTPPFNILDGNRLGDIILSDRLKMLTDLKIHVFSHIHEGHGIAEVGATLYANVCICDEENTPTYPPTVLDMHYAEDHN